MQAQGGHPHFVGDARQRLCTLDQALDFNSAGCGSAIHSPRDPSRSSIGPSLPGDAGEPHGDSADGVQAKSGTRPNSPPQHPQRLKGHNLLNEDIRYSTSFLMDQALQIGRNFILGGRIDI